MFRLKTIRRNGSSPRLRAAAEAAFAALLILALLVGGRAALAALRDLMGFAAAPRETHRLALDKGGDVASAFPPQLLFPVAAHPFPRWLKPGARAPIALPAVAIDIDDLGEDVAGTERAIALPRAVALAFLPYAKDTPALARAAEARGHEVIAHVPMEAVGPADPGPMALRTGLAPSEIRTRLLWSLARVPGAIGINNHEGSRFTLDARALAPVAAVLAERRLFFFNSRTIGASKVVPAARARGVLSADRDVFLDDTPTAAEVVRELAELERDARANGIAIAIGHPHAATLDALARWFREEHGLRLVTLSEALRLKSAKEPAAP